MIFAGKAFFKPCPIGYTARYIHNRPLVIYKRTQAITVEIISGVYIVNFLLANTELIKTSIRGKRAVCFVKQASEQNRIARKSSR
jgi:hypothetical protein